MKNRAKVIEIYDKKKQDLAWIMTSINNNVDINDDKKRALLIILRPIFNSLDDTRDSVLR